jgi:glycosyltransferase involved in cell wall biosynthesis
VPEVTVVIPTHSAWPLLAVTLAAALAQEDVDLEVVVVDDGSTDETPQRLAELEDPRVRVFRNDPAQRAAAARNRGIAEARGRWIAFLDHDDLWAPGKLRRQLDAAAAAGAVWAYAGGLSVNEHLEVVGSQPAPPAGEIETSLLLRFNTIPCGCSNVIARADVVRAVGGFDPRPKSAADWDMWLRLSAAGPAASVDEPLIAYVEHAAGMSSRGGADIWDDLAYFSDKFRSRGFDPDGVLISRWVAGSARRAGDRRGALKAYLHGAVRYRSPGNLPRAASVLLGDRLTRRFATERPAGGPAPAWLARMSHPAA